MSRFNFCDCPAGFSVAPERHAPDCPGRSGAGKPSSFAGNPCQKVEEIPRSNAARSVLGEQEIRKVVTEALVSMVSAVVSASPPPNEPLPDFIQAPVDRAVTRIGEYVARLQAENAALQKRLTVADQRADDLESKLTELVSAVRSINHGKAHELRVDGDDEPQYGQRKEWIHWVLSLCSAAIPTPQ
jgi:hypothetical protein